MEKPFKNSPDMETMRKIMMRANNVNVILKVCHMALKTFEVDSGKIPDEFEVVDNAFTHILQMKNRDIQALKTKGKTEMQS